MHPVTCSPSSAFGGRLRRNVTGLDHRLPEWDKETFLSIGSLYARVYSVVAESSEQEYMMGNRHSKTSDGWIFFGDTARPNLSSHSVTLLWTEFNSLASETHGLLIKFTDSNPTLAAKTLLSTHDFERSPLARVYQNQEAFREVVEAFNYRSKAESDSSQSTEHLRKLQDFSKRLDFLYAIFEAYVKAEGLGS